MPTAVDIPALASPLDRLGPSLDARRGDGRGFDLPLSDLPRPTDDAEPSDTRESAEELVGMALILPLLKQARQSPFQSERMHGGFGEDAFTAQLDEQLADTVAKRVGGPLVESLMRTFEPNATGKEVDRRG